MKGSAMHDATEIPAPEIAMIDVILEGGPRLLSPELHPRQVPADTEKVKLPYGNGYEHFERTVMTPQDAAGPVVFNWTGRTFIAE
jgi:hypothetical protein